MFFYVFFLIFKGFYYNIDDKNCSLSIVLTAMDQKLQKS